MINISVFYTLPWQTTLLLALLFVIAGTVTKHYLITFISLFILMARMTEFSKIDLTIIIYALSVNTAYLSLATFLHFNKIGVNDESK